MDNKICIEITKKEVALMVDGKRLSEEEIELLISFVRAGRNLKKSG